MKTFLVVSTPNWSHIMIFWIFVAILLHVCLSDDVKYNNVEDVIKRLEQLSRSRKSHQLSGKIRFIFNLLFQSLNLNAISIQYQKKTKTKKKEITSFYKYITLYILYLQVMDLLLLDGDGQIVHQQVKWFTVVCIFCIYMCVILLYLLGLKSTEIVFLFQFPLKHDRKIRICQFYGVIYHCHLRQNIFPCPFIAQNVTVNNWLINAV